MGTRRASSTHMWQNLTSLINFYVPSVRCVRENAWLVSNLRLHAMRKHAKAQEAAQAFGAGFFSRGQAEPDSACRVCAQWRTRRKYGLRHSYFEVRPRQSNRCQPFVHRQQMKIRPLMNNWYVCIMIAIAKSAMTCSSS